MLALWAEVFPEESAWNHGADVIDRKLQVQQELFLVVVEAERVLGTLLAGYDGVRGWVHRLAVTPSRRRQGLASLLMAAAEHGLRAYGCAKLNLQVRGDNLAVLEFYRALGYAVEDRASLGKALIKHD